MLPGMTGMMLLHGQHYLAQVSQLLLSNIGRVSSTMLPAVAKFDQQSQHV